MKSLIWRTNDPKSSENLYSHLNFLKAKSKGKQVDYLISIKQNKPVRSTKQNSYYWIILQAIAAETGDIDERLHEYYKMKYNFIEFRGEKIARSTSELDTAEFTVYVNKVKAHAMDFLGVFIVDEKDRAYSAWEQITKEKYNAIFSSI